MKKSKAESDLEDEEDEDRRDREKVVNDYLEVGSEIQRKIKTLSFFSFKHELNSCIEISSLNINFLEANLFLNVAAKPFIVTKALND